VVDTRAGETCRASRVRAQEIEPGLWRWTALHPEWSPEEDWGKEVGCVYYESSDAVVLIDPLVPPEDPGRFWAALDRDVERADRPVHVLITIFWHARSASELLERYPGTRVWAHEPARKLLRERTRVTDVFRVGDELSGGVTAVDAHRAYEVLFWIPVHRAVVAGDVLLGTEAGGLNLCPDEWLGTRDPAEVRQGLREGLLELPVERVLPAHGEPVLDEAKAILESALA
jgi:glyoxylase-like metal-dependent hydrolase (beta-lactamase superfamily II)